METLMIILKIALVALCGVGLYYLFIFSVYFWNLAEAICLIIETVVKLVTYPFKFIKNFVEEKRSSLELSLCNTPLARFVDRHPTLGTPSSIRFLILGIIFIIIMLIISMLNNSVENLIEDSLNMYPFFFIVQLISNQASFSFVGLISAGFSAMLIGAFFNFCMGDYERKGSFLRWLVAIGYYIVTTTVACYLGLLLSNVWEWFGNTGVWLFNSLKDIISGSGNGFFDIFIVLGCLIALIIVVYIGIILILVAVKEYVETFCYGAMGAILFAVVLLLCFVFGSQEFINSTWGQVICIATLFISIFVLDFIRVNKVEILGLDEKI